MSHDYTIEELELALAKMAYIVLKHGKQYTPIMDRIERELEAAKKSDPTVRAQRILQNYMEPGGRKAIRFNQL